MAKLIFYYLWKRFQLAFSRNERIKTAMKGIVYGGFALFYGYTFGGIVFEKGLNINLVLYAIHLFVGFLMIISIWIPQPAQKDNIIAPIYPISKFKRSTFHWFVSLWGIGPLSVVLLYGAFLIEAGATGIARVLSTLGVVMALWTIQKSLIKLLFSQFQLSLQFGGGLFMLALSIYSALLPLIHDLPNITATIALIPALTAYFLFEFSKLGNRKIEHSSHNRSNLTKLTSFQLVTGHTTARNTLLAGLFLKLIFLVQLYFLSKGNPSPFVGYFIFLFATPVLTFSYVFNNIWGFFPEAWIHVVNHTHSVKTLFREYLRFLIFPLTIDAGIGLSFIALSPQNAPFILTLVLVGGFILIISGFAASTMRPKVTGGLMKLSGNTHIPANFSQLLLILPFCFTQLSAWFYLIIPLYFLAGYVIFKYVNQTYEGHRKNIYQTLFK